MKNIKYIDYLPFIILFIVFILIHLNLKQSGDDLLYAQVILDYNDIIPELIKRYYEWSSRIIIEFNLLTLIYLPMKVWKILNSVILVLIAVFTSKFFNNSYSFKNKELINNTISSILVLIFFLSSYNAIASSGWISVSLNYIWPLFFLILHFYLLKKYILNKKLEFSIKNIIIYLILVYSLFFTCNHEQGLVCFVILYGLIIIYYLYKNKKINSTIYLMIFLIIISGLIIFLAPGNSERYLIDLRWFPEFVNLSFINKIDIGLSSFFRLLIGDNSIISLVFLGIFGIYNYIISKNIKSGIISSIPFIICFVFNIMVLFEVKTIINLIVTANTSYGLFYSDLGHILFFIVLYLIITICILYGIINIKKYKGEKIALTILTLLSLGFITSITVGFTPTVWTSRGRMFIYFFIFLYFGTYILIIDLINKKLNEENHD
ncbi:MAG: hypothetical protein KO202_01235 [Methanobacteriaceae archaeon]|jgi:hypothetical protein|nr:hypothetical protein [Methanobacteriaceae archaeon]